jgi:hypothetical protein
LEGIQTVGDEFFNSENLIPSEESEVEEDIWDEDDPFQTGLFI